MGSNMPIPGYFAPVNRFALAPDGLFATLGPTRNDLRLPIYARLDLRLSRTFNYTKRRLTFYVEVLNVLNRENFGPTNGGVRCEGEVLGLVETLFPLLPSAGIRIEF